MWCGLGPGYFTARTKTGVKQVFALKCVKRLGIIRKMLRLNTDFTIPDQTQPGQILLSRVKIFFFTPDQVDVFKS
jgi:hypothetical protein